MCTWGNYYKRPLTECDTRRRCRRRSDTQAHYYNYYCVHVYFISKFAKLSVRDDHNGSIQGRSYLVSQADPLPLAALDVLHHQHTGCQTVHWFCPTQDSCMANQITPRWHVAYRSARHCSLEAHAVTQNNMNIIMKT